MRLQIYTDESDGGERLIRAMKQEGVTVVREETEDADAVVLFLNGQESGFRRLETLRIKWQCPVVVVGHEERVYCYEEIRSLELGADDYVEKPFNPLELVARVKSQLRRYTQLGNAAENDASVYTVGGLSINDDLKEVTVDGETVKLTPIEYNILLLLVKNQGKVFSINQIYESIWNEDAIGADNTVAVHIRHIREKIEINPKEPRYLKVVWGVGYKIDKN